MPPTADALFHLDPAVPEGTTLYAGPVLLRGWAVGTGACFITDLRVRVGGRIFPVFYGHPRPDVARHLGVDRACFPAGFEVELLLAAGENRVEFELCDAEGRWRPLATPVITATPAQPVPWRTESGTLGAHEFARALRLVLQRSVAQPIDEAATAVVAPLPIPFVTRYAALPFHGHLHQPPMLQRADVGRLIIEGWLFHEATSIRRVVATTDLQAWAQLDYGATQPYVAGLYPQFPHAAASRAEGFIDIPSHLPQPVSVRVFAELEDGTWHLCHVQRTFVYDGESNKAPYGRLSPVRFVRAVSALRRACAARQLEVKTDKWFWRALREVWAEYRARAATPAATPDAALAPAPTAPPRHVTLVTHNLNFEGAPLFLVEYARQLAAQGTALSVVAGGEGPLRRAFEEIGASIQVVDAMPVIRARDRRLQRAALDTLAGTVNFAGTDLVVANTLAAWWAVHLAARAGRRSLFYIHESTTPDAFFHGYNAPDTLPTIKRTFTLATHVSFLTDATRRYYRAVLRQPNHSINPGWIDLSRLQAFRAAHSRESLRAALGIAPDTPVVINVGTVCDRKGQHMFARAVDLLWRRRPELAARCHFLVVGGRHSIFDRHLADVLVQLGRPNLRIVGETATPYDYYGAADLFVCSSYEESFPRVVLEAMGFALPIVSTDVHGIPEMTRDGREAALVPPGNPAALASAMETLLSDPALARRYAEAAALRVAAEFDAARLLPRHAALAGAVAAIR